MNHLWRFAELLLGVIIGTVAFSVTVSAQGKTVTCESKYQRYHYCRVNTQNSVRLTRKLSHNPCTEGRSWGYDKHGVWVDDGCRAVFEVAFRHSGGWENDYRPGRPNHQVPNWAIGHFRGYNPLYRAEVDLRIHDNGKVVGRVQGSRINGHFDARAQEIVFSRVRLRVNKERHGLRTTQIGDRNNVVSYTRIR